MATPGRVRVAFGAPLRLTGDDYEALAKQVEDGGPGALTLDIWSSGQLVIGAIRPDHQTNYQMTR